MKKIDFRSSIIGLLGGVCIFLMMGQNRSNMGHITAKSITIENDYAKEIVWLGPTTSNNGLMEIYNSDGTRTNYLSGGAIKAYNEKGMEVAYFGTSAQQSGIISTSNQYGKTTVYLGTGVDLNGIISLKNSYGETKWFQAGE